MIPFSFSLEWVPGHLFKIASEIEWGDGEVGGGGGGEERKRGEGFLFVWGRLLKRGCLSEQRPSTISLLHLFVSWANLSSVVQACPLEILSLYILSPAYFGEEGATSFLFVLGIPTQGFPSINSWMFLHGVASPSQLPSTDLYLNGCLTRYFPWDFVCYCVCLSVLLSDFFSCTNWKMWRKLYRNECLRNTWMNDSMIDQTHEWIKKGRMEGRRVRRTADLILLVSIIILPSLFLGSWKV